VSGESKIPDLEVIADETGSPKFNLRMNPIEKTFFLEKW
jgi:hypothetical protein